MQLEWRGTALVRLTISGASVDGAVIEDPLLGPAHVVTTPRGRTTMSALDWARPTIIPAIAAPALLAGGAGRALLNAIAELAVRAGVPALQYAGPYPTPALFQALGRSFRTAATEAAFTADLLPRAARLARDPIAIDFVPAPHVAVALARGHVELRDGTGPHGRAPVRVVLDGIAYEPGGSPARLSPAEARDAPGTVHCDVYFGDTRYARVATLAADGRVVAGPHALPVSTSRVLGVEFPVPLAAALGELVAEAVPAPLAAAAAAWVAVQPPRWADLGARAARMAPDGDALEVHAALWDHVGPLGLARLVLALAEAIAPLATAAVIARLTSAA